MTRPDFSSRGRAAGRRWEGFVLGAGILAAAWSGWLAWDAWSDLRAARSSLERREAAQAIGSAPASTNRAVEEAAAKLQRAALQAPANVVSTLAEGLPDDARYTSIGLAYESGVRAELSVSARSAEAYDELLERLAKAAEIEQVRPGEEIRGDDVQGRIQAAFKEKR